jgi:hypothetical protein
MINDLDTNIINSIFIMSMFYLFYYDRYNIIYLKFLKYD